MAKEIERKYLVKGDAWRKLAQGVHYRQGYLNSTKERTVRIRTVGEKAVITVNLDISSGLGAPISEAQLRIDLI